VVSIIVLASKLKQSCGRMKKAGLIGTMCEQRPPLVHRKIVWSFSEAWIGLDIYR
jgi:hypothetical protein